jgi:hypothetical protein
MINIKKYKRLTVEQNELIGLYPKTIKTHVPSPTDTDFKKGYITRYFAQKANDESSYVFEVNKDEYGNLITNPFFLTVKLNWRLTGTIEQIRESNSKSVTLASNTLKSIYLYLPNKLQFHKR